MEPVQEQTLRLERRSDTLGRISPYTLITFPRARGCLTETAETSPDVQALHRYKQEMYAAVGWSA